MGKDDATWLNVAYVLFGLLMTYLTYKTVETVSIQMGWEERYDTWLPTARMAASFVLGALSAIWLRSDKDRHEYFLASIGEMRKVSYPTFIETRQMTIVVVVVCIIFGFILAGFDFMWGRSLKMILGMFGKVV